MKVFVDTSVWINYLNGSDTKKSATLAELIKSGQPIYSLPVVIQEIFQGFKHDKDIEACLDHLGALVFLKFEFLDAVEAARMYRILRKRGITAATIDLQIASVCQRQGLHLLTNDRDFLAMSKILGLALV